MHRLILGEHMNIYLILDEEYGKIGCRMLTNSVVKVGG